MKTKVLLLVFVALSIVSCKKDENKSTTSTTHPIIGRWKLVKLEEFKNSTCTTTVNNINHPNLWIEFTNQKVEGGDCANYMMLYNLIQIFLYNCDCQTIEFSQLTAFDYFNTEVPSYFYQTINYYYNISGDYIYLCGFGSYKIEQLNSNSLILYYNNYNNNQLLSEKSRFYFVKM